jgi:pyrimidine-specific ribonucleoside hydrolase
VAISVLVVVVTAGATAAAMRPVATASTEAKPHPVVIDTDMSVDDWMAILFLLHRSDVSVKAITVSGTGVAHGAPGARNAIRLLDLEGRRDIPVAYGRATTYRGGHAFPKAWRPAVDAMLGIELPPPSRAVSRLSAAKLIAKVAAKSPVEILELGPPTNVADALRATPALRKRVTSVTLMSGALNVAGNAPGNKADWNFYVDPVAADIVLRSGIPWTLVPLDATNAVPYNEPFVGRLGLKPKTKAAHFVHQALSRQMPGEGLYFWDPFAAAVLVDPSVATLGQRTIRIVTTGVDAGRTVAEEATGTQGRVALEGRQERFEELFLAALNARTRRAPKSIGAPSWVNTGPRGGSFVQVAIHPKAAQVVFARSVDGLFRSADGGASWRRTPAPRYLRDIALHPEDPRTVYAVAGAGVYRTTDGGASWTGHLSTPGVLCPGPCPVVYGLAVSPSSPQVVYAVSHDSYEPPGVWLWSSADTGRTWVRAGRVEAAAQGDAAVFADPVQPTTVYVLVGARGVFRSQDGGKGWEPAGASLPVGKLSSLAVDPAKSGVLYAGTDGGDVFRSVDHGTSWTASGQGSSGEVSAIAVGAADGAVYAGTSPPFRADGVEVGGGVAYRSADGQAPWRAAHSGLTGWYVASLAADATKPGRVLAATEHGIFVTQDGGATWKESVLGVVASNTVGLAVHPANPRVVFAAVERGIGVSRDGGRTWRNAFDARGKRVRVGPLLAVPGKRPAIYAVKRSHAAPRARSTLLVSRNAGRTWSSAAALPVPIGSLVADPSRPATLYGIGGYAPWPMGSIFKSVDGGRRWRQVYAPRPSKVMALAVDPIDPNVLYAGLIPLGTDRRSPLLKSENGGRTWRRLPSFGRGFVVALAADPHRRGTLYAVRSGNYEQEVRISRDGGRTWAELGRSPADAISLLVDPARPGVVYVGAEGGLYVKVGGSPNWRRAGPTGSGIRLLAVDSKARRLYAGVAGRGVAAVGLPLIAEGEHRR